MTESVTIPVTAVSVLEAKPKAKLGLQSVVPMSGQTDHQAFVLMRAALTQIPDEAVIVSAFLQPSQYKAGTGSVTLSAKRNTSSMSTASTWSSRPSNTSTNAATQTRSAPAVNTTWTGLDVTTIVTMWQAGDAPNYGFTLTTTSSTAGSLRSTNASGLPPVLVVEYTTEAAVPEGLHPASGVVSVAKPTLTFQVAADTVAVKVDIDAAADGVSPDYSTGEITTSAGLVDLTRTDFPGGTYAGLADDATTQWRAYAKNAQGWSAASSWVSFGRKTWDTLTIDSPGATSEDDSPVVTATYGGTATSWQAEMQTGGKTLEKSGWTPGDDLAWGSTKSVGAEGLAVMRVTDDEDRVATPGDPDYLTVTQAFTVAASGNPDPITDLAASQVPPRPGVIVTGEADEIPDEVSISRDGVRIARVPGADVFTGSGPYTLEYTDLTASMNTEATYTVTAIVNGEFSDPSDEAVITPTCLGIWLYDTEDGSEVVIWGDGEAEQTEPELSIVHETVSGPDGSPQVVRRRLARYPRRGGLPDGSALKDVMFDADTVFLASTSEANLAAWAEQDAGHLYRLVLGNKNDEVIIGDIDLSETSLNSKGDRVVAVALNWWAQ